jgi:hypothetical protein
MEMRATDLLITKKTNVIPDPLSTQEIATKATKRQFRLSRSSGSVELVWKHPGNSRSTKRLVLRQNPKPGVGPSDFKSTVLDRLQIVIGVDG